MAKGKRMFKKMDEESVWGRCPYSIRARHDIAILCPWAALESLGKVIPRIVVDFKSNTILYGIGVECALSLFRKTWNPMPV